MGSGKEGNNGKEQKEGGRLFSEEQGQEEAEKPCLDIHVIRKIQKPFDFKNTKQLYRFDSKDPDFQRRSGQRSGDPRSPNSCLNWAVPKTPEPGQSGEKLPLCTDFNLLIFWNLGRGCHMHPLGSQGATVSGSPSLQTHGRVTL